MSLGEWALALPEVLGLADLLYHEGSPGRGQEH